MGQSFQDRLKTKLSSAAKKVTSEISPSAVSGFIVKRLIVKGSFKNVSGPDDKIEGFQIQVKNRLGVATIVGIAPVKIDEELFGTEIISIKKGDKVLPAAGISEGSPFAVGFGDVFIIFIEDAQGLEAGKHVIALGINIAGAGMVETQFDETLSGSGVLKRVKKSTEIESQEQRRDGGETGGDFSEIMKQMVEMAIEHIGQKKLADHYKVVRGIVLDLKTGDKYGVKINPDGAANFVKGSIEGEKVLKIIVSRADFHKMAHGELNPGLAFARGDIKLEGISLIKLRGMDEVLNAIFRGYRAASKGLKYDEVEASQAVGGFEGYLAMTFVGLDKALKFTDKKLAFFGVKYFYEKTLNRIEHAWDIFDRQIRDTLSFGRPEKSKDSKGAYKPAADEKEEITAEKADDITKIESELERKLKERLAGIGQHASERAAISPLSGLLANRLILSDSFSVCKENDQNVGFELRLKNRLGAATLAELREVALDDSTYQANQIQIKKGGKIIAASDVSEKKPLQFQYGEELLLRVKDPHGVKTGKHNVSISADIVGFGLVNMSFEGQL